MPEGIIVYVCPGCGMPVEADDDYVVAREYDLECEFSLHMAGRDVSGGVERRFHVEHFRGRLGERFYELMHYQGRQ
jgi:hypothetical protein